MKDFIAENDCILEEWRNAYVNNNQSEYPDCTNLHEYFTPDGIMFKGDFLPDRRNYSDGKSVFRWKRNCSGEENTLWTKAPLRVLFLTKDQNSNEDIAWDVRSESFRYRDENYKPEEMWLDTGVAFYRNLVYSLYCILKTTIDQPQDYNKFTDKDALSFVDKQIFARINCKKEVGNDKCPDDVLLDAINRDKSFLERQINNLDADIFICCGYSQSIPDTGNRILNLLNSIGYHFKPQDEEKWIFYDSDKNKVAINSYHLSYLRFDYVGMISAYHEFLKRNPAFTDSHRK